MESMWSPCGIWGRVKYRGLWFMALFLESKWWNDWYSSYKPAQQAAHIEMAGASVFLLSLSGIIPIPPFEFVCPCGAEVDWVKKTCIHQVVHVDKGIMGG